MVLFPPLLEGSSPRYINRKSKKAIIAAISQDVQETGRRRRRMNEGESEKKVTGGRMNDRNLPRGEEAVGRGFGNGDGRKKDEGKGYSPDATSVGAGKLSM